MATQRMLSGQHEPVGGIAPRPKAPRALPRRIPPAEPHTHSVHFGHEPEQIQVARAWCRRMSGLDDDRAYPLVLVLTEMYTNAITHTASGLPGGRVRLDLTRAPGSLRLAVTDQGPRPRHAATRPQPRGISLSDDPMEHGRGLALVQELCRDWGYHRSCGLHTTVWAVFNCAHHRRG